MYHIPSSKLLHNNGTPPSLMGKLPISMAMFNSCVNNNQRVSHIIMGDIMRDIMAEFFGAKTASQTGFNEVLKYLRHIKEYVCHIVVWS